MSSLQNFAVLVLVARSEPPQFGAFTTAIAAATLLVGFSQAALGESGLIKLSAEGDGDRSETARAAIALAVLFGLGLSILVFCASLALHDGALAEMIRTLSFVLTGAIVQDVSRFLLVGQGRAFEALMVDFAWIVPWLIGIVVLPFGSASSQLALWGGTAAVGGLVGLGIIRPTRPLRAIRAETRGLAPLSRSLVFEWLCVSASAQMQVFGLAAIVGVAKTGGLRAAESLFGPVNTAVNAVRLVFVREMARRKSGAMSGSPTSLAVRISVITTAITLAVVAAVFLMPDSFGRALYRDNWTLASAVLLPVGLVRVIGASATGPDAFMRGVGLIKQSVRARTATGFVCGFGTIALAPFGVYVAAYGSVVGTVVYVTMVWYALIKYRDAGHLVAEAAAESQVAAEGETMVLMYREPRAPEALVRGTPGSERISEDTMRLGRHHLVAPTAADGAPSPSRPVTDRPRRGADVPGQPGESAPPRREPAAPVSWFERRPPRQG